MEIGLQNTTMEWSFFSTKQYQDPFNEVELTVCFKNERTGVVKRVPAFWAGVSM